MFLNYVTSSNDNFIKSVINPESFQGEIMGIGIGYSISWKLGRNPFSKCVCRFVCERNEINRRERIALYSGVTLLKSYILD
jgi:hypothetical protein